jgi:hypothetical protein
VDNTAPVPVAPPVRFTALNDSGKVIAEATFKTLSRHSIVDYKLQPLKGVEYPLILLQTGYGAYEGKQYYALIGRRFDLVRLEGYDGKAKRNYYCGRRECGPVIPKQTDQEWEADLTSNDRLRVLRALVWLGGIQRDAQPADLELFQAEDQEDMDLVRKVRERKNVMARLRKLGESKDQWEREAAQLALHPQDNPR